MLDLAQLRKILAHPLGFTCRPITLRVGRWRERRYANYIFIQIYFIVHHFIVNFSKFSLRQAARRH